MTSIACPACHAPNPVDYRFCENCGGILPAPMASGLDTTSQQSVDISQDVSPNASSPNVSAGTGNAEASTVIDTPTATTPEFAPNPELSLDHLVLTHLECAAASVVGRTREHNEDHFWFGLQQLRQCGYDTAETTTYRGAFILCDGMGGHDGGEIASALATKTLKEGLSYFWANGLPDHETFQEYIHYANQVIWEQNQQQNRHRMGRMGTTLVMLLVDGHEVAVGHVGDSRVYCITTDLESSISEPLIPSDTADTMPDSNFPTDTMVDSGGNASGNDSESTSDHTSQNSSEHSSENDTEDISGSTAENSSDPTDAQNLADVSHGTDPEIPISEPETSAAAVQVLDTDVQQAVTDLFSSLPNHDGQTSNREFETYTADYTPQAILEQLTEDHEVATQLIANGLDPTIAYGRPDAHQLTQALGPNLKIEPEINYFTLGQNTLFLLCSDGLCDNDVVEQYWQDYLLPLCHVKANLAQGVKDFVDFADRVNGHDNITALLVKCCLAE